MARIEEMSGLAEKRMQCEFGLRPADSRDCRSSVGHSLPMVAATLLHLRCLRRMLDDLWGLDLDVIETELTLAEVTPAMAELRELAQHQLAESHEAARRGARSAWRSAGR